MGRIRGGIIAVTLATVACPDKGACLLLGRGAGITRFGLAGRAGCQSRAVTVRAVTDRRQRLLNTIAGVAFAIGGSLFALGSAIAQIGSQNPRRPPASTSPAGCSSTPGATPRCCRPSIRPEAARWRWWGWEPERVEWLSALVLFAGTIVFGVNLLDSFLQGLTAKQVNRLIWAPDMSDARSS